MKRKIIIMCVTLTFLLLISAAEQYAVSGVTKEMLSKTQEIIAHIREKRLEEAADAARSLDRKWDGQAKWLETIVNHKSTDDVRYAFSRLIAALEEHDSATAMVYASELEGAVEHALERQALTLENIF